MERMRRGDRPPGKKSRGAWPRHSIEATRLRRNLQPGWPRAGVWSKRGARAVAHALSAKRPKTRYLIGRDARIQLILRKLLPDRVMDRITMWYLGLG